MKLALRTTKTRQSPLPMRWLQCKMLDLLTLTEKAIEKKKKHFVDSYSLKAICYGEQNTKPPELDLTKIKEDNTANEIMHKYRHLVQPPDIITALGDVQDYQYDDDLSHKSSKEFLKQTVSSELNFEDIVRSPSLVDIEPTPKHPMTPRKVFYKRSDTPLARTQAWVEEDINIVKYSKHSSHGISSGDTDQSINNIARFKNKKNHRKHKLPPDEKIADVDVRRRKKSKGSYDKNKTKNVDKCKNRDKTSKTRLIKKVVKKKSSYNILIKTCSKKISSPSFGNCTVRPRRKQDNEFLYETASKPIQKNLIELCRLKTDIEEGKKELSYFKPDVTKDIDSIDEVHIESTIAKTEKSLLIDIIMDDKEETIALRRTIGTDADADDEPILLEQEIVLGSLTNVMKADSFYNKNETENVHSQTIFIYDINEPSTSKGVRHVSMDVQCGPDNSNKFPMLSATTSFTRMPKIYNTGIKIGDSSPDIQIVNNSINFGTSTEECENKTFRTPTPRMKSVGIRIKDSDTTINNERVESGTMTQEYVNHRENDNAHVTLSIPNSFNSATDTQLLKPVSSRLKMEDSGSEFCESVGSFRKSPFHFANLSKNTSDFQIKSSVSKDVGVERKLSSKYVRPKLCCGGVHVHSYKDRQTSEDVVYQGEWQRYKPKALTKRRAFNPIVPRRFNEIANKKTKSGSKENVSAKKDVKLPCKRLPSRKVNFKKSKEECKVEQVKEITDSKIPTIKCNKNNTKIAAKIVSSSVSNRTNKVSFVTKKSSMTSCIKKDNEKPQRILKKSYLPLYLKRKLAFNNKPEPVKLSDSTHTMIGANKESRPLDEVIESKDETKDNLLDILDFNFEPRENVSYVVFRNETDTNPDSDGLPFMKNMARSDSVRRSPSPQSQNSSAYSSPNSIATVRARSTGKSISDRRFSTSSNKSNLSNSQCESTPVKNKKFTKRAKNVKKSLEKDTDNKENVPESSKRNRDNEKTTKGAFTRNKSVYRAHVTSECSPQSTNNSVSRTRPQTATKSNVRIPTVPCSSRKQSGATSSRPSVSKKSSPKSRYSSHTEIKSGKSSVQTDIPSKNSQQEEHFLNLPQTNEGIIMNIVDNSLLSEWMSSTYKDIVDSHTSNILAAMRQLVEERLDFIEHSSDNLEVDSKTIVLSKDKLESVPVSASTSFHDSSSLNNSFGTVITKEEAATRANVKGIESVVNNTLGSILGEESFVSFSDHQRTGTDLDLLSFKSLTSASRLSEYFLAESSLNNITGCHSGPGIPVSGSLRDIFERKTQLSVQNLVPGALAVQAFSGFSMNAEPIAGDQPDRINIIDSETGSLLLEYNRQTTSEELFVSGRSSGSYESCLVDEDAVVPYWLFQIINQQQAVDEEEEQEALQPMPVPLPEPMFDVNGNVMEPGMGAGAGAGDGRGIHSDHSQDSSGRGTSLSSSATSSGPQSEAILIDPAAFAAQFDLTREPINSSVLVPPLALSPDNSFMTAEGAETSRTTDILNSSGERCERTAVSLLAASDIEADVSSLDTDVPDSSDN